MTDIIVILYTVGDYVKKKRNMQKCQMGAKFTMKRAVKASLSFYCMAMTAAAAFFRTGPCTRTLLYRVSSR